MLFNFQHLRAPQETLLLLISNLTASWSGTYFIFYTTWILRNLLCLVLWPLILSIFVRGPWALEKNLYSSVGRYSMNINYVTLVDMLFKFSISLLIFPLLILSLIELLNSPIVIMDVSISPLSWTGVYFLYFKVL